MSDPEAGARDAAITELPHILQERLRETSNTTSKWSLYSLSVRMSEIQSDDPFGPCIVAIGITHPRAAGKVMHMQAQKWVYMNALLKRTHLMTASSSSSSSSSYVLATGLILQSWVRAMAGLEAEVRHYFGAAADEFHIGSLLEVMILDGCFILELLIRCYSLSSELNNNTTSVADALQNPLFQPLDDQDPKDDPVLKFSWILSAVRRDLALLENQIPYLVLQKLFDQVTGRDTSLPHDFLVHMITLFFQRPSHTVKPPVPVMERGLHRLHLLNLLLNIYRPATEADATMGTPSSRMSTARRTLLLSATSLAQVGVKFKSPSAAESTSLLDIRFRDGVFEIPTLHITKWTDSFFRNIIAFERCCPDRKPYVASYLELMSRLIVGQDDVRLLERRGILINDLGSDEEIIVMLNSIGRQFDQPEYFYYQELCDLVDSSYNTMWNLYRSQLQYQYFRSPWAVLSMLAATVLLLCTMIQAIYAALYYNKRN